MSKLAKESAQVSYPVGSSQDHSALRGHAVKLSSGSVIAITAATTDVPIGIIVDGGNGATGTPDSVAICGGGAGVVKVKLSAAPGSVVAGSYLALDGSTLGTLKLDPGGAGVVRVARALESGAAGELIDAIPLDPTVR